MLFQASNNKEKNQIALRPASWAGCPKPRPSHRAPNFREHAGICLTKINLAPNVYFCHYFQVVRVGRATQVRIFYRPPLGSSLGCPLGQSSQRTLGNNKNSVEAKAAGATSSLSKISCLGTSQSCFLFSTWVNNSDHGTATKTDKGTHGGPREIYFYHTNRTCVVLSPNHETVFLCISSNSYLYILTQTTTKPQSNQPDKPKTKEIV